jgi:hypothetical protein
MEESLQQYRLLQAKGQEWVQENTATVQTVAVLRERGEQQLWTAGKTL